jgi:hypothetical protein
MTSHAAGLRVGVAGEPPYKPDLAKLVAATTRIKRQKGHFGSPRTTVQFHKKLPRSSCRGAAVILC